MTIAEPKISALGESAVVVEFGSEISDELNQQAIGLAEFLESHPFPGFVESVPGYASTTVFYELPLVRRKFCQYATAFEAIVDLLKGSIDQIDPTDKEVSQVAEVPAIFDKQNGPDLRFVSESTGMAIDKVIERFTSAIYRVYMVGFLPGFAYMGEVDERLRMPRKQQPRQAVPKGSIGIAGRQTGIYPLESPGGWQLIGRTDVELFTPDRESPTLFQAGDRVRFVAI